MNNRNIRYKKSRKGIVVTLVILLLIAIATGGGVLLWAKRASIERVIEKSTLPVAMEYKPSTTPAATVPVATLPSTPLSKPTPVPIPAQANLAVPFTPQAPHANWEDPYGELCEEASVLMAMKYVTGEKIAGPDAADRELLAIKDFEDKRFGFYKDTTAEQTAVIFREHYKYDKVRVVQDPSVTDIKQAIAEGKLVLVPAAGRMLGNPYFQSPGPLYHMFVVKGYTDEGKFIVNDPGTRRGADFLYSEETIMNAMHDWRTDANIDKGEKVMLVVG